MPNLIYVTFAPKAGILNDVTSFTADDFYYDGNRVRFKDGFPEPIGGWTKRYMTTAFVGKARALREWVGLDGISRRGIGTTVKYYVEQGGGLNDITPIRSSSTINNNPFATTNGSAVVTVTDTSHGAVLGDYVTYSGASAVAGLTLNAEYAIVSIIDANSYTINAGSNANATTTGGGASVVAAYQINIGLDSAVFGSGWGSGPYSRGTWGSSFTSTDITANLRLWTHDNWGEDLFINPRNGGIYFYDTSAGTRATNITAAGGASDPPSIAIEILVASTQRLLLAFGTNTIGTSTQDNLLVRWCNYEDYTDWTPDTDSAAGSYRFSIGSTFVTSINTEREILVWTDAALYSMQFMGTIGEIFHVELIDPSVNIIAPNAKTVLNGKAYWMEKGRFRQYDGRSYDMPCTVKNYVFNDINIAQAYKITCGANSLFNEVWWHYPSADSEENDRYVAVNVLDGSWHYGALMRTAWLDAGVSEYPQAASTDGYIYYHENGVVDGSSTPSADLGWWVESAPISVSDETGTGHRLGIVLHAIPDLTFKNSTAGAPSVDVTFKVKGYPGSALTTDTSSVVEKMATIDQYTERLDIRLRARAFVMRVASGVVGTDCRMGTWRFEVRSDGRKY